LTPADGSADSRSDPAAARWWTLEISVVALQEVPPSVLRNERIEGIPPAKAS